jgi:hypothetical protein
MPLKTPNAKSFMLSPPTNNLQAYPPIATYMSRLQNNFGAVSQTNGKATQVQRHLFSPQNQKKKQNGNEKNWQKLSFKHIPTKQTFP